MAAHVSAMDTDDPPESVASSAASPWAAATALQAAYPDEDLSEFMVGPVREDVAGGGDSDSEDADAPSDEECAVIVLDPEEVDRRRKLRRIARSTDASRPRKPRGERESGERKRGRGRGRGSPGRGRHSRGRG